jgi:hypothetical protein
MTMRRTFTDLARNLAAGLRLALYLPVSRLAFRIDLAQLLLLLVVSAVIDLGVDWFRYGTDGYFTWFGLGNEIFGAGVLLITAAVLALAFGQRAFVLALPVLLLSGFPLLQVLRVAPGMAFDVTPAWDPYWAAFEVVMILWVFVLSARSVLLALAPTAPGRWWRAAAGALALIAPMWFASAIAPNDSWWKEPSAQSVDPRFPNPASEPVLAAQQHLLDEALSGLDDERPDVTDLYFVGFAGDAREDVFRKDVLAAQRVMDERWGTEGRSLALINSPRTLLESPAATMTNLREALNEIGGAIDVEQDVVMVYLASHGNRQHVLEVALPPLELAPVTAPALRSLLDDAGIKWRIVIVSACYSGGFIEALMDDHTVVLTASDADRASFGCGHRSDATLFGEALFQHGLAQADSLLEAFEAARVRVVEREKAGAFAPPSNPQIFVGPAMADKLKELDRGNAARRTGRTV